MKNGIVSLLLLGIVAVLLLLGIFIFGPWELPGFGQLSQRQIDQAISAAEVQSPTIPPGDSDQDGFSDEVEKWIKTDAGDNCADDANDSVWPPDFNNDKVVNTADADMFKPYFGQRVKSESSKRFDLNKDKKINLSDVFLLRNFFDKGCPYYFITNTSHTPSSITLNWAPALPKIAYPQLLQIYYGDMTAAQTTECSNTNKTLTGSFAGALTNTDVANYLKEGTTSYTWDSTTSAYKPIPGHKYCIFFSYVDTRDAAPRIVSSFMQITTDLYNLTASPSPQSITLNWTPGLKLISSKVYTQIRYGDMTQAQTTECSDTNSALTGSNGGTLISSDFGIKSSPALQEGQTSYIWNSDTSNYTPISGHKYCLYIMQSNETRTASTVVSNFVESTVPSLDNDNDGFTNKIEEYIGTDPNDNCPDGTTDAAWPPDFNNDTLVNQADIDAINVHFATKLGDSNYDKRFDLNASGNINLEDTYVLRNYYGKSCTQ